MNRKNRIERSICKRCVMDSTDPAIRFDGRGVCNHCYAFDRRSKEIWYPNSEGAIRLERMVNEMKNAAKGSDFHCIIGLSGGVDSSFLALKLKEWQLKPLVLHVDTGWNSELAVSNIEKIVRYCDFDLYTKVVDWPTMRELQAAYLKSGLANLDVPQDHAIFANLYKFATKHGIKYVLSGGNFATESVFPEAWHGSAMDSINLRSVFDSFGKGNLKKFETIHPIQYYVINPFINNLKVMRPLDLLDYNKEKAMSELKEKLSWRKYDHKHGESNFTKIFQNYILPYRYGYDKRKPHLSSLVLSQQITRNQALKELRKPLYNEQELFNDIDYFCRKLEISLEDFDAAMDAPLVSHSDFSTWDAYYRWVKIGQHICQSLTGKMLNRYS